MIAGSKGVSRKKEVHKQILPLALFLPANPRPSHDLVLVLLLQRSASPVSPRHGTNQALLYQESE